MRGYAKAVPVTWKGVTYRSISECARALGLTAPTIAKRLREGTPLDEPPRLSGAEAVVVEGVKYSSHSEAAKAYHLSLTAFHYRLRNSLPMSTPKRSYRTCAKGGKKVTIGDVTYPTLTAAAKALGMSVGALWMRLLKGQEARAPLRPVRKPCMLDGRKYPTLTICADMNGVSLYKAKKMVDERGRWL